MGIECVQLYRRPDGRVVTADCGNSATLAPKPEPLVLRTAGVPRMAKPG